MKKTEKIHPLTEFLDEFKSIKKGNFARNRLGISHFWMNEVRFFRAKASPQLEKKINEEINHWRRIL